MFFCGVPEVQGASITPMGRLRHALLIALVLVSVSIMARAGTITVASDPALGRPQVTNPTAGGSSDSGEPDIGQNGPKICKTNGAGLSLDSEALTLSEALQWIRVVWSRYLGIGF